MMRVFFSLTVAILLLTICNGNSQTTNAFDFLFNRNTDNRTLGYELRAWNGSDTTTATLANSTLIGYFSHDSLRTIFPTGQFRLRDVYPVMQDGRWIKGWLRARSIQVPYLYSTYGESAAYKTDDLTPPQTPNLAGGGWTQ